MKNIRICKVCVLLFTCLLGFNLANMEAGAVNIQNIVNWNESYDEGGTKEFSFYVSVAGTLYVELDNTIAYDDYSVFIKDNLGTFIYDEEFDWLEYDDNSFSIDLEGGNYTIGFFTDGEVDFSVQAYFEYKPSVEYPVFELNEEYIELYVGESAKLTVESEPEDIDFDVKWSSSKPSVATVDSNGVVKAKKSGIAVIRAVVNGEEYECEVCVEKKSPTYKEIYSILKKNKGKNFSLDVIDVGNKCRLYARGIYSTSDKHWYTKAFMSGCSYTPYIELVKKGDKIVSKLCFLGMFVQVDLFDSVEFEDLDFKLKTKNRRLSYDVNIVSSRSYYNYKNNYYVGKVTWNSTLSSSTSNSTSNLNKFAKMLNQNTLSLKIVDVNGASFEIGTDKKSRSYWKKLLNIYKQILKRY